MLTKGEDGKYYVKGSEDVEELYRMQILNDIIEGSNLKEHLKDVIKDIIKQLDYYLDLNNEYKIIVALWIVGTYMHQSFEAYPYLFFNAMRGSGKTRALKLITKLCKGRLLTSLTESTMFRTSGVLGIDEFESISKKEKQELRELLNASYKKGLKIIRMEKIKDRQVPHEMEAYRPIVMANIYGMDEVLGDRCIQLILEKSSNPYFIKQLENFENDEINYILMRLCELGCSLCSVVTKNNYMEGWNNYIRDKYNYTKLHTTLTTLTTLTTSQEKEEIEVPLETEVTKFYKIIDGTSIDGRALELFFPLYVIAYGLDKEMFESLVETSKRIVNDRKIDEITESKDILVYRFVSEQDKEEWIKINTLTSTFRNYTDEEGSDWLNSKWMGRALKRLNLIKEKVRKKYGMEVILDVNKAKRKMQEIYGEKE